MSKASFDDGFRPAKVRIIVTKHVHADARQFKAVVQSLTGMDSVVTMIATEDFGNDDDEKMQFAGRSRGARGAKRLAQVPPEVVKGKLQEGLPCLDEFMPSLDELFEFLKD